MFGWWNQKILCTVDLILNCTALSFMLGVDNLMNEGFAMFTPKGYGKKEEIVFIEHIDEETQLKKMLARVRKDEDGLKRFEFGIWINFLGPLHQDLDDDLHERRVLDEEDDVVELVHLVVDLF